MSLDLGEGVTPVKHFMESTSKTWPANNTANTACSKSQPLGREVLPTG